MELKFHGARRLTIRAWDALRESKGTVVFISGNAAVIPRAGAAAVGAINAAIEALAKAFAERGIEDGVQVNSVSPGAVMTTVWPIPEKRQGATSTLLAAQAITPGMRAGKPTVGA